MKIEKEGKQQERKRKIQNVNNKSNIHLLTLCLKLN